MLAEVLWLKFIVTFGERWTHMVTNINADNLEVLTAMLVQ